MKGDMIMSKLDKLKNTIKSLRFIIVVIILVAGIVPATVLSFFIVGQFEDYLIEEKTEKLQSAAVVLKNDIISSGFLKSGESEMVEAEINALISSDTGRVMVINQDFVVLYDTYGTDKGKTCIYDSVIKCFQGENRTSYDEEAKRLEITVALTGSNNAGGVLLLDFSTDNIGEHVAYIKETATIILIIIYLLVIAIAVAAAYYAIAPFKRMGRHIRELEAGNAEIGQGHIGYTEMEEINDNVEEVILRLQKLNESREEFVSNVSHELKTPITSIKVLADSLNAQENVPNEMYKEFMQDIAVEIDRESSIINDLLALMRMNKDSSELKVSQVNINEIVEMVIKRVTPIANKRNIEIILESFKPVTAEVDEVKFTMAVTNLIENAVKYNVDDGWVRVSLNADMTYFYLKVSDSGIGIPEDAQIQVFERFFRVDKARSRETGGTGLGLAITNTVVNMHKGEIKLFSREGEGSTFTVRIPMNYVP